MKKKDFYRLVQQYRVVLQIAENWLADEGVEDIDRVLNLYIKSIDMPTLYCNKEIRTQIYERGIKWKINIESTKKKT